MNDLNPVWLVTNASSGSNGADALDALEDCCREHRFVLKRRTRFPDEDLPDPASLDAEGFRTVAVFAGDGTVNTLLTRLRGWGGAVLVLPGGTMNLLYRRLHGERTVEQTIAEVARGEARRIRPGIIRCAQGDGYAGVLAGPGTSWGEVREALREADLPELASSAVRAIEETLAGELIACAEPQLGRAEGYPLIDLTPRGGEIEIAAYYADSADEYLEQAWALLRRNFREGPHDVLGRASRLRLAGANGGSFGLLIDGEQAPPAVEAEFRLVPCEVDLIATEPDGA
jgi:hypothetical protein